MLRPITDTLLTGLASVVLRLFFRSVEIRGRERIPADRPLLIVANHFNGFVDPVMLIRVLGRLPRFLATSLLWRRRWLRPFLALAGMIPVYRPEDADVRGNVRSFDAAEKVLLNGGVVGIFPEGRTHDETTVSHIHTGAARIALGAHAAGVSGLAIVATGLTFDDKISLRSRVLAHVGEPIDVDEVVATLAEDGSPVDDTDRRAVRALTDMVAERLRAVSPDYPSFRDASALGDAAEIALRYRRDPWATEVPLATREELARRLARAPVGQREEIISALAAYYLDLHVTGLREEQVGAGYRAWPLLERTAATIAAVVLLAPLALVGFAWNVVPYAIVTVVGRLANAPVTKGTARLIAALAVFPAAWAAVVLLDPYKGVLPGLLVVALAPVLGLIAVATFERVVAVLLAWRAWLGVTERRTYLPQVTESRNRVVDAVADALAVEEAGPRSWSRPPVADPARS